MDTKEAAALWVEALRSGKWQQGQLKLRVGDAYCCLGVACAVYQQVVGGLAIRVHVAGIISYNNRRTILPPVVQEWLGLSTDEGAYEQAGTLSLDNDRGKTFQEIADIIEARPAGLFV